MRHKNIIIIVSALCISFAFSSSLHSEVHANEKIEGSDIIREYQNYSDVSEIIQSGTDSSMYLKSLEKVGNVYQAIYSETNMAQRAANTPASPRIIVSETKQVRKTYSDFDSVPSSISYEEYNNTYNTWMSGTLFLKEVKSIGRNWYATFEGTLVGTL